jgi:Na+/alanine symporter
MFMNYMEQAIASWLLVSLMTLVFLFSVASIVGFAYWMARTWKDYTIDDKVFKTVNLIFLGLVELYSSYLYYIIASWYWNSFGA